MMLLFSIALTLFTSCGPLPPPGETRNSKKVVPAGPSPDPNALPRPTDEADANVKPIIQYWDNGNFIGGKPSSLLFAAWRDGKVLRVMNNRTYVGFITEGELSRLLERLAQAGVESAPFPTGVTYPDGGSQLIYIDINDVQISLKHDSNVGVDDLDGYQLPARVTRQQMTNFIGIWFRAVAAIDDIWPVRLDLITGMPAIPYPNAR